MASTPIEDSSNQSAPVRPAIVRSISDNATRHERPRPKHNVKFTVGDDDSEEDEPTMSSSKRLSIPEIRLPEIDITESNAPSDDDLWRQRKEDAALTAHSKANRHADRVKKQVGPAARRGSTDSNIRSAVASPYASPIQQPASKIHLDDIPLTDLGKPYRSIADHATDDDESDDADDEADKTRSLKRRDTQHVSEARRLLRTFTTSGGDSSKIPQANRSGTQTPLIDQYSHEYEYVKRPDVYQRSVLSHLLAAQNEAASSYPQSSQHAQQQQIDYIAERLKPFAGPQDPRRQHPDFFQTRKEIPRSPGSLSGTQTPLNGSGESSGAMTPRHKRPKWYKDKQGRWQQNHSYSTTSLGQLLESSLTTATGALTPDAASSIKKSPPQKRLSALDFMKHPVSHIRNLSSSSLPSLGGTTIASQQMASIASRLESQEYIIEICRALMIYGAPTHRLEEFLSMAARKLCIQASFQYLPGCMIMSFDDPDTHTTELKLIREATAVDLGKLMEVQNVYKAVIHNQYSLMEAMDDLREIRNRRKRFSQPLLILMYGIAAVSVGPFAFGARPIDFPISFILGCILGTLQIGLASRSSQFSHIFEVFGTFVTSFAARGFGSIMWHGQPLFCFSSLAQSSIALILPGWIILAASLELQSRNIIAGSIRMVYAIIYTLFLGFGILIGTTIMGLIYPGATNDVQCAMPSYWTGNNDWTLIYTKFIWVPIFSVALAIINQAKFKQMPMMIIIAACGYQVNFWSGQRFSQNTQISSALGAFVIGVLANGYSRFRHGVAAAAMLPAIFVLVPSGLAASGSLIAGLTSANQITHNATGVSIINNGAQGFYDAQNNGTTTGDQTVYGGTIFNVGYGMVQVAIGISVGLFLSALIIYPFGKKRSGIFSF